MTLATLDLATLELHRGGHSGLKDRRMCVMEAVAYFAGEQWTDHPQCASELLTVLLITLNDVWDHQERQLLVPLIPGVVGTRDGKDAARLDLALDWLVRVHTPAWLASAGLHDHAQELRSLTDLASPKALLAVDEAAKAADRAPQINSGWSWIAIHESEVRAGMTAILCDPRTTKSYSTDVVWGAVTAAISAARACTDPSQITFLRKSMVNLAGRMILDQ